MSKQMRPSASVLPDVPQPSTSTPRSGDRLRGASYDHPAHREGTAPFVDDPAATPSPSARQFTHRTPGPDSRSELLLEASARMPPVMVKGSRQPTKTFRSLPSAALDNLMIRDKAAPGDEIETNESDENEFVRHTTDALPEHEADTNEYVDELDEYTVPANVGGQFQNVDYYQELVTLRSLPNELETRVRALTDKIETAEAFAKRERALKATISQLHADNAQLTDQADRDKTEAVVNREKIRELKVMRAVDELRTSSLEGRLERDYVERQKALECEKEALEAKLMDRYDEAENRHRKAATKVLVRQRQRTIKQLEAWNQLDETRLIEAEDDAIDAQANLAMAQQCNRQSSEVESETHETVLSNPPFESPAGVTSKRPRVPEVDADETHSPSRRRMWSDSDTSQ